jgi:hypothetical protein
VDILGVAQAQVDLGLVQVFLLLQVFLIQLPLELVALAGH